MTGPGYGSANSHFRRAAPASTRQRWNGAVPSPGAMGTIRLLRILPALVLALTGVALASEAAARESPGDSMGDAPEITLFGPDDADADAPLVPLSLPLARPALVADTPPESDATAPLPSDPAAPKGDPAAPEGDPAAWEARTGAAADDAPAPGNGEYDGFLSGLGLTRNEAAVAVNVTGALGIIGWGVFNWDYFQRSPRAKSEDWFERDTKEGGADKLGHLWTTYAASHMFAGFYRDAGYSSANSNLYGTASGFGLMGLMELGDSFSDFGFAYEDMIGNTVGAAAAYVLGAYPALGRKFDLRVEYRPDFNEEFRIDAFTDYESHKYLLAIKLEGFDFIEFDPLRYLEIHLGFFARGYDAFTPSGPDNREQTYYLGFGINVTRLIRPLWDTSLFNYFQVPATYWANEKRID